MIDDISNFRQGLARAQLRITGRSHRFVQALLLEALRRLVLRTPVDTGRARGAWQATGGAPATSSPIGAEDRNGATTIAKGAAAVATLVPGQDGYAVNNVTYIGELEKGHSRQAPNGMVAVTLEELKLISDRLAGRIVAEDG